MAQAQPIILAIQNDETDAPHLVGQWLEELGFEIQVLQAFAGEEVPTVVPDGIAALLPLGGHMNATEDHLHPWLAPERVLLKDAIDRDIPIFAICLGTQLLAVAGGGKVERAELGEVGIYEIKRNENIDSIFTFDTPVPVAQWHEDQVKTRSTGLVAIPMACNSTLRLIWKS